MRVVAVCSRSGPSRAKVAKRLGCEHEYTTLDDALANCSASVFLVCLPRDSAAAAITACFRAGKDVISEKPCAWSLTEGEACWREAALARRQWRVLENWAFKPGVLKMAELLVEVEDEEYDFVLRRRSCHQKDWRASCSKAERLLDISVHPIRALRCWFGEIMSCSDTSYVHETGARGRLRVEWCDSREEECCVFTSSSLRYDVDAREISDGSHTVFIVQGDPWIEGGARATLKEAISSLEDEGCSKTCAEEALRDLRVAFGCQEISRPLLAPSIHGRWISRPRCVDDVVAVLHKAKEDDLNLLARGAGSSWGRALEGGTDVQLIMSVLRDRVLRMTDSVCVVQAGIELRSLVKILSDRGFTLPSLPVYQESTLAGATATGSHGSSALYGTLSDQIVAVHLAFFDGNVAWIAHDEESRVTDDTIVDPELFCASCCSVGRLGIVLDLALRIHPSYKVSLRHLALPGLDESAPSLPPDEHVWFHWTLTRNSSTTIALLLSRDEEGEIYNGRNWFPYPPDLAAAKEVLRKEDTNYSSQFSVPFNQVQETAIQLSKALRPHLLGVEDRVVIEVKLLLSSNTASCAPNAVSSDSKIVACFNIYTLERREWVAAFEDTLFSCGATPHLGKAATICSRDVHERYPRLAQFLAYASCRPGARSNVVNALFPPEDDMKPTLATRQPYTPLN